MKKCLCLFLAVILAVMTASPALSVSAADAGDQLELIEGTYAPHQVIVMFDDDAIDADTLPRKSDLASVGADFGEMMSAFSSEDKAFAAADDEAEIIAQSLGDDFVLEETLIFSDADLPSEGGLAPVGAGADADGDGSVTVLDATAIQRYLANLPANENIGKPSSRTKASE